MRATYQRLVNRMFKDFIKKTMDVYINEMMVKLLCAEEHLEHLKETFDVLEKY